MAKAEYNTAVSTQQAAEAGEEQAKTELTRATLALCSTVSTLARSTRLAEQFNITLGKILPRLVSRPQTMPAKIHRPTLPPSAEVSHAEVNHLVAYVSSQQARVLIATTRTTEAARQTARSRLRMEIAEEAQSGKLLRLARWLGRNKGDVKTGLDIISKTATIWSAFPGAKLSFLWLLLTISLYAFLECCWERMGGGKGREAEEQQGILLVLMGVVVIVMWWVSLFRRGEGLGAELITLLDSLLLGFFGKEKGEAEGSVTFGHPQTK